MTTTKKSPHPVDVRIGARVRVLRMSAGISQETLGNALGITFQQVQKYEKGTNRIAGSRLVAIAAALATTVAELTDEDPASPVGELAALDPTTTRIMRICQRLDEGDRSKLLKIARTFEDGATA